MDALFSGVIGGDVGFLLGTITAVTQGANAKALTSAAEALGVNVQVKPTG